LEVILIFFILTIPRRKIYTKSYTLPCLLHQKRNPWRYLYRKRANASYSTGWTWKTFEPERKAQGVLRRASRCTQYGQKTEIC